MEDRLQPALVAGLFGVLATLVLTIPYVAIQYRRRGTVGAGRAVLALAALFYALGLVAYILLPLPQLTPALCANGGAGVQLRPGTVLSDIVDNGLGGPAVWARNPAVQQAVLNVVLFVPLGMLVRYLGSRTVLVTTAIGLGVSLLLEMTQLTGVWFAFPCAYRLFDVDDLIVNTLGALLGAATAPLLRLVPGQHLDDHRSPGAARPVTPFRRLLGMTCDWLIGSGIGAVLVAVWSLGQLTTSTFAPAATDARVRVVLLGVLPAAVVLAVILRNHRTPGEALVRLRPVGPVDRPRAALRWLLGIGGYLLLSASESTTYLALLLALASGIAVLITRRRRGLAYRVLGWDVQDERTSALPSDTTPLDEATTTQKRSRVTRSNHGWHRR